MKTNVLITTIGILLSTITINAQTPTPPNGKKWVKVDKLTDEFNTGEINPDKWFDYHPFWKGREPSRFKKGNATVSNGFLRLKSDLLRNPNSVANPLSDIWVNSAAVVSKEKSAKPGYYYECSMKASSLSMTSSFWFRVGSFSEIDVIEHVGSPSGLQRLKDRLPKSYNSNTHYYGKHQGVDNVKEESELPANGRDRFFTYGFWWKNSKELIFYLNGKQAHKIIPARNFDENLHMIFDTEVFPFAQAGIPTIGLPLVKNLNDDTKNTMLVNWVRTYKLEDDAVSPPNTGNIPINKTISLRKSGGDRKFVTGELDQSKLIARANSVANWEKFRVETHPKGGIALKALSNNKYVQVPDNDTKEPVRPNGSFKGDWERFEWKSKGTGKVAFRSFHTGKWLQAPWNIDNTIVVAKGPTDSGWETFEWKTTNANKLLNTNTLSITAFPNPTTDVLTVNGINNIDVRIYSLNGTLSPTIIRGSANHITLDTSNLEHGIYFLETKSGKRIKFVKE